MLSRVTAVVNVALTANSIAPIHDTQGSGNFSRSYNVELNKMIHVVSARFNDNRSPTITTSGLEQLYLNSGSFSNSGFVDGWYRTIANTIQINVTHPANNPLFTFIN